MPIGKFIIAVTLGLAMSYLAYADDGTHKNADAKSATGATLTTGEIRKVDKDTGKITIKHGPIHNLAMPAMTMVFKVMNPAMLDQVAAGDKIKFVAERTGGALVVTQIELDK